MAKMQQLTPAQQAAQTSQQLTATNAAIRSLILAQGYQMFQQVAVSTFAPANNPVLNVPPKNVGLMTGLLVQVSATIHNANAAAATVALTPYGIANLVKNFTFTDLQNYQRINTSGRHLTMVNSFKQGRPFMSSTPSDSPIAFGDNYNVVDAPASIAAGATATVSMYYWVPMAYARDNLAGAIYMNVVNATANLQITMNPTPIVAAGVDAVDAVYQGAAAADTSITSATVRVYQSYWDQLPQMSDGSGPMLPPMDINTMYTFQETTLPAVTAGTEFFIPYSNFRRFMSTYAIYDNAGAFAVDNIDYWAFQTANMTYTRKADPKTWMGMTRQQIQTDTPIGGYFFDTRARPIYTTQTGNTDLVLFANAAAAGAKVIVGWEALANVSNLINAGSLGNP